MVLLRARRVEVFVPPKNGQELLKRASEENFSMFKYWELWRKAHRIYSQICMGWDIGDLKL
jgi:hypothetical protein